MPYWTKALTIREFLDGMMSEWPELTKEAVALEYAKWMWSQNVNDTRLQISSKPARLNVALAADIKDVARLTRRGILIAESLLLATGDDGTQHQIGNSYAVWDAGQTYGTNYVICSDISAMGSWITDCRKLIENELAVWLPTYNGSQGGYLVGSLSEQIARHRIATWTGKRDPLLNRLVHPVLRIELPYIDGTSLHTLSQIIVNEGTSYEAFRDFLRRRFLDLDMACDSEQMDRELIKIGTEIADGIRGVGAELDRIRSRRAVAATGAAIGSVVATLVAVYGPAFGTAASILGAGGGVWGMINAMAESRSYKSVQESTPWYFVWTLARASQQDL